MQRGSGIAIGTGIGVALGAAFDNIALGLALGVAFGAAFDGIGHARRRSEDSEDDG